MNQSCENCKISDELNEVFLKFLQDVPAKRLGRNLRKILVRYLIHEHEALPVEFGDFLTDLDILFGLLDAVEGESSINNQL
jgi:hypothetical protein